MAEEEWDIGTADGFRIYGVRNKSDKKKNDKAIIYIHGLSYDAYDYAATRMAMTFPKQGYDVIRLNLYSWQEDARSLTDCTFKVHASDINAVYNFFKKQYKKLFAVGFSYGGPSLMEAKVNQFDAISLWDPTYIPANTVEMSEYKKVKNLQVSLIGKTHVMSTEFIDAAKAYDRDYAIKLAKKCKSPIQVIYAGKDGFWIEEGESFHTHSKGPTDERVVKATSHFFHEEGATAPVLRYTKKWFDQF